MLNFFLLIITLFIFNITYAQKDTNNLDDILLDADPHRFIGKIVEGDSIWDISVIQEQPIFPGGWDKLFEYLQNNIKYPEYELLHGITGRVVVQFVVWKDGTIKDVSNFNTVSKGLNEEAVRIVKNMPLWIPGKQNGKVANVSIPIPVKFTLPKK